MFLVGMFSWWYSHGLGGQFGRIRDRLMATIRFFSIGQLLSTFFAPFRQISAGKVAGSAAMQLRAFFDQLTSRIIGAIVRFFTIIFGAVTLFFQIIGEVIILVVWIVLPALPVMGLIAVTIGWVPSWM